MATTIGIFINDKALHVSETASIHEILKELNVASLSGIAVAVNEMVIPRDQWENRRLEDQDKILIVKAAQGG